MGIGGGRRRHDFGLSCIRATQPQILLDRPMKQIGVLRYDGDHPADLGRVELTQVVAADADGPGLWFIQPRQQPHDGGLAGAAGSDDADALAGADPERQPGMGRTATAGISKRNAVERDLRGRWAPRARRSPRRPGCPAAH